MRNGYNLNWGVVDANVIAVNPAVSADMERSHMEIAYYGEGPANTWPYALRVHDSGMVLSVEAFLASVRSVQARAIGHARGTRGKLRAILWELQHPKQLVYFGPNIACAAGVGVWLSPWVNVRNWRWLGWYIANTGGNNPIGTQGTYWCEDPAGALPFTTGNGSAVALIPGTAMFDQSGQGVAGIWSYAYTAALLASWLRLYVVSALGTTARCAILGMR